MEWKVPESHKDKIPAITVENLEDYVNLGYMPGHFLTVVLENDLFEVASRADLDNRKSLFALIEAIYNFAPGDCWGNRTLVTDWSQSRGLKGREK